MNTMQTPHHQSKPRQLLCIKTTFNQPSGKTLNLISVVEHLEIVLLVRSELLHSSLVLEEGDEGGGGLLERLKAGNDLGAAVDHIVRDVLGVVEALVDVHSVVNHVGVVEKVDLRLQDVVVVVELPLLQELQEREHKVPVEIRRHPRS